MRYRAAVLTILYVFVFAASGYSQNSEEITITIDGAGLYATVIEGEREEQGATGGKVVVVSQISLIKETDTIQLRKGARFGFYITLHCEQEIEAEIEILLIHPEFFDPYKNEWTSRSKTRMRIKSGRPRFYGYLFEEDYEMVSGYWIFEVFYNGNRYATQIFNVIE